MNQDILLHISLIEGIGPTTVKKILDTMHMGGNLQDLYQTTTSDFMYRFDLSESAGNNKPGLKADGAEGIDGVDSDGNVMPAADAWDRENDDIVIVVEDESELKDTDDFADASEEDEVLEF